MRKRTEVWIVFGTKLFRYRKENKSAKRFRNEIVVLWETALEWKSFSEPNCSVMRKRTEEEIVFGTKLFCYRKENRSAKRFGTKLFSYEKGKRSAKRFENKIVLYGKEKRSAKRFRNKIVLLWEREQKCESFSEQNCSVIGKKTEVEIVCGTKLFSERNCCLMKLLSYRKEHWSGNHFRNQIVLLWEREQRKSCESFSEQNCSVIGKEKRSAKRVLFCYENQMECLFYYEKQWIVFGQVLL